MALKQDTSPEAGGDPFLLKLPAEEGQTAKLSRFLDALVQAMKNTIKKENQELRRFRPHGRVVTTYRPSPPSPSHRRNPADRHNKTMDSELRGDAQDPLQEVTTDD